MAKRKLNKIRHQKKKAFIVAYSETGNVTESAEMADISRTMHYYWLQEDPVYAEAFTEAHEAAADRLEQEARRRAVKGVQEPVFYQGEMVGTVRKYSDNLLMFLLKGTRPEKFKDRVANEHSGPAGGPIQHSHRPDLSKLSDEELSLLESILGKTTDP